MSVINQLLIDLEKRRASSAERSAVPNHVRALPAAEPSPYRPWLAGAGVGLAVAAASWAFLPVNNEPPPARVAAAPAASPARPVAKAPARPQETPIRPVTAVSSAPAGSEPERAAPASRLSLQLSRVPAPHEKLAVAAPSASARPLPAESVLRDGRARAREPSAAGEHAARAAPARREARAAPAAAKPEIRKEVREPTAAELAEIEYRKATRLLHAGRLADARAGFESALQQQPAHHAARQALVGLHIDGGQPAEAERLLEEGLAIAPAQSGFAMTLARLQVDRGAAGRAVETLQRGLEHALGNADYLGFLAALLQRESRHGDAIAQYQAALQLRPSNGVWWIGLGLSLQALNRLADARAAFHQARATQTLSADLAAFADQRLRDLR